MANKAMAERPQYMGAERAAALANDEPQLTEEEIEEKELADIDEDTLVPEEKTFKKRYSDLRKYNQEQVNNLKQEKDKLAKELKDAQKATYNPGKSPEEIQAFREENPEAFDILSGVAGDQVNSKMEELESIKSELEAERNQLQHDRAEAIISSKHPDWGDIKESGDFHDWAEKQSKLVQEGIYDNASDGATASQIVSLYKMEKGLPTSNKDTGKRRKLKEDASKLASNSSRSGSVPDPASKRTYTNSEIDRMSLSEFEEFEDDIMLAKQEGRIILDE